MKPLLLLALAMAAITAAPARTKVACVGNSITYGFLVQNRETNAYPAQLGRMLGPGYEVVNFGHSGTTVLRRGHRPYMLTDEFHRVMDFKADIAVIHLGVNDTDPRDWPDYGDEFMADYIALADSLRASNPRIRLIMALTTPLSATHKRFKSGTRDWRDLVNKRIADAAAVTGAELIDFGRAMRNRQNLLVDGIHPDSAGATVLAATVCSAITGNYGGLRLPEVYSSGMVIQRYVPFPVSGTADAGATVTVKVGRGSATLATASATAGSQGRWRVELPPMAEGTGFWLSVTDGTTALAINDVAVGEVWIASGQSNMEFRLGASSTFAEDSAAMADPLLRLFDMKPCVLTYDYEWTDAQKDSVDRLLYYLPAAWRESDAATAPRFSAVAWHFGRTLRDSLRVPVGVICNAVGGSTAASWVDITTLEHGLPEVLIDWRHNDYIQPWAQQRAARNTGSGRHRHPYEPAYLYAAGVEPLAELPVAGVIWYQGESDAHNMEVHESIFRLLVDSWRKGRRQPDMPFIFAQLSSLSRPSWPAFRNSQRLLEQSIPGTYMAVTSDLGDSLDVHPRDKRPVGRRLARQALHNVYSMTGVTPSGPRPVRAVRTAPGTVILTLDRAEGLTTADGAPARTFEMARHDGLFTAADAEILPDNTIKITSMDIDNPRFIRYGWQPFTRANLINSDSLPASTFSLEVTEAPGAEPGIDCGVSAACVGIAGGRIIRAGGCNFPSNPMAPGSEKRFYSGIYELLVSDSAVTARLSGHLPAPMAYGSAVTTPQGLAIIGGDIDGTPSATCMMISPDSAGGLTVNPLPDLPVTADNTAAAYAVGVIYLAGGSIDGTPSCALYALDLADLQKGWQQLKSFPGNPRVQPVLAASDADGRPALYLWGGFAGKGPGREATLDCDGWRYDIGRRKWTPLPAPLGPDGKPLSLGGGVAVTLPDGRILACGGVNADIFLQALRCQAPDYLSHPAEWYSFNPHVVIYSPATATWTIADTGRGTARAGASATLTPQGDAVVVTGGEIKPRIRTTAATRLPL